MIALRYLHRKNKAAEREMLEIRDRRAFERLYDGVEGRYDSHDVEALLASLLMTPSWERETEPIRSAINRLH